MPTIDKKKYRYSFEVETATKKTWGAGGTADIKFYQGTFWRKIRSAILRRDNHLCQECKRNKKVKEGNYVDHIKPRHLGGGEDFDNLETLCASCHNTKSAKERKR